MGWKELDSAARAFLIDLYAKSSLTVDDLPYTREFDAMLAEFNTKTGKKLSQHEFWRAISSARKTGKLRRKER
ncbi:MAG: hypothetical protein KF859_01990 [Phycisphaeraceae bacterium]|nr:hypothetical protein [Phycisphaeraceae bacterium]